MDALFKVILGAVDKVWINKEWVTLLGILYFSFKQTSDAKVQKATCAGKFDLHSERITNIDKKAEEARSNSKDALSESKKALDCATRMGEKVTTVSDNFEALLSGKFDRKNEDEKSNF